MIWKLGSSKQKYFRIQAALLEKLWRISQNLIDDTIAKLYVTYSFVKKREMEEIFVTYS